MLTLDPAANDVSIQTDLVATDASTIALGGTVGGKATIVFNDVNPVANVSRPARPA